MADSRQLRGEWMPEDGSRHRDQTPRAQPTPVVFRYVSEWAD